VGCSSCETWLDRYVDGDLEPHRAAWVARHLLDCPACERLHRRLRNVDALLETVQPADLSGSFTSTVMAQVREMPPPAVPRRAWWTMLAIYLLAGWVVLGFAILEMRSGANTAARSGLHALDAAFAALGPIAHSVGSITPFAVLAVVLLLTIDVLLFAVVAVFYRRLAPRLAAHLSTAEVR
jgi:anti-sigma factor RsiW